MFNSFFEKQCLLIDNGSTLLSLFPLITVKSLWDVEFMKDDIKNISKLDSNKAHGGLRVSIIMLSILA